MEKKLTAEGRKDVVVILIVKTVKNKKSCRKYGLLHFEPFVQAWTKAQNPRKQNRASLNRFLHLGIESSYSPAKIAKTIGSGIDES
jgi:hypothetical protein